MITEKEFLALVERHQGIIYKICAAYREGREDKEDLFQEIVFQLWKSLPTFSNRSTFSTWMYRIALTTAIAPFRKKQPKIAYTGSLPESQEIPYSNRELQDQLFAAIKLLTPGDRAILLLHLEELSYKEIAEVSGLTENHVGVKLNRIKNKIVQLLKNHR